LSYEEILAWRYERPHDFYDTAADPFDHPERLRYVCESRRPGLSSQN
jgi:hypothetical protein